ncbi:hypothetical protein AVEN_102293-1 [Araneus ventricosus]|uniref:Uncharacterized protein n=1 Tax=Araneus ventricosus TaxID=182803 RepID=A0A4Y2IFR7_ARAVE|nr:hypothetical protein AVEN_102293-1 [Araneus ventricosus]
MRCPIGHVIVTLCRIAIVVVLIVLKCRSCEWINSCSSTVSLFPHDIVSMVENRDLDNSEEREEGGISRQILYHTQMLLTRLNWSYAT